MVGRSMVPHRRLLPQNYGDGTPASFERLGDTKQHSTQKRLTQTVYIHVSIFRHREGSRISERGSVARSSDRQPTHVS